MAVAAVTNDFLIPPFSFFHDGDGYVAHGSIFFLALSQLTLETLVLWW